MRALGRFTVAPDHPGLPGHFPGNPLVPGVVLLDQAAALILAAEPGRTLHGFPAARFLHPVRPGDEVLVQYEAGEFTCTVAGRPVLRGRVSLSGPA